MPHQTAPQTPSLTPCGHTAECNGGGLRHLLDSIRHGLLLVDRAGIVQLCNARAAELLDLPRSAVTASFPASQLFRHLPDTEISYSENDSHVAFTRDDGVAVEIHVDPLPDGGRVLVIEDVTENRRREQELRRAEAEYRSLFDNAVCGIYRDSIDGRPLRANRALITFNGYETEEEYQAAVKDNAGNWYVDPDRARHFMHLIQTHGEVRDLVSEVYSHKTRRKYWITENAWYVRDGDGAPIYIEGTIQDATERVEGMAAIERQANTDQLTGAASRFHLMNRLKELTSDTASSFVLYSIDLDRFKEVNDLLGHAAGDAVLKEVSMRLHSIAGPSATVARLGGDEFAILVTGVSAAVNCDMLAEKIVRSLRVPVEVGGQVAAIGASVGIALYPAHASSAKELLSHADLALYQVKSRGRDGACMFDPELKSRQLARKALESDLREAIGAGQLELYYQPIVDAVTGTPNGYEALMRWNHPRRGFVQPGAFISVAEEAGFMTELGNWAIRTACEQAALLPAPLGVAVNVSPSQFRSSGIVEVVRAALKATELAPGRLTLELTETAILSSETLATQIINDLIGLGVKLALDDFGTGYSSLSYLQRFAFSKVKIDRSFVAEMEAKPRNLAIIRAIIRLAGELGIEVVAEGIETGDQAQVLRAEGCASLQGYLYGRPARFTEILGPEAAAGLRKMLPKTSAFDRVSPSSHPKMAVAKRTVHKTL